MKTWYLKRKFNLRNFTVFMLWVIALLTAFAISDDIIYTIQPELVDSAGAYPPIADLLMAKIVGTIILGATTLFCLLLYVISYHCFNFIFPRQICTKPFPEVEKK